MGKQPKKKGPPRKTSKKKTPKRLSTGGRVTIRRPAPELGG